MCFLIQVPRRTPYRSHFRLCTFFLWRHLPHTLPSYFQLPCQPSPPEDNLRPKSAPNGRAVRRRVAAPPVVPVEGALTTAIWTLLRHSSRLFARVSLDFEPFWTLGHSCVHSRSVAAPHGVCTFVLEQPGCGEDRSHILPPL